MWSLVTLSVLSTLEWTVLRSLTLDQLPCKRGRRDSLKCTSSKTCCYRSITITNNLNNLVINQLSTTFKHDTGYYFPSLMLIFPNVIFGFLIKE